MNLESVLKSRLYKKCESNFSQNGTIIESVVLKSIITRNNDSFYLALLDINLKTENGLRYSRCLVLRGDTVIIVPIINCCDDHKYYTILVEQIRIINGNKTL